MAMRAPVVESPWADQTKKSTRFMAGTSRGSLDSYRFATSTHVIVPCPNSTGCSPDHTMTPRLRVLISSTDSAYPPSQPTHVNSARPTPLKTPSFEGEVSVWVKGYAGDLAGQDEGAYFAGRGDMTYGIVVRGEWGAVLVYSWPTPSPITHQSLRSRARSCSTPGRFLEPITADDLLFGNTFEHPIKNSLPWGTAIATKFIL